MVAMPLDSIDEETEALVRVVRDAIDGDHYPLSPRVQTLRGRKLRPEPARDFA